MQAVANLPSGSKVHLTTAVVGIWPAAGSDSRACSDAEQQQSLWGMLKVAALDAADLRWSHSSTQAQQTAAAASEPASSDAYSTHRAAGAWLVPRLLPAEASSQHTAAISRYRPGATVVAGGLGALGTLLAAQQLCGSGSAHLVLLGRSVALASLEASLGAAWRRAVHSGSTAVLTVQQCDSAAAADTAGLACSLRNSGVAVGSLIHAAGVLKVSTNTAWALVGCRV